MEQGHCLDSTRMSARQEARGASTREPALDAAVTALLSRPEDSTHAPQVDVADLASACLDQVKRLGDWDARPDSLTEEEGDAEMDRWGALFRRAIDTPSANLRDLAGKAHLMLDDLNRFHPLEENNADDYRLMRVILAEAMAFGGITHLSAATEMDPALAVIEEGRRLLRAFIDAHHIYPEDPATSDLRPEWVEADRVLLAYLETTLLHTVPLTAAGCRELARFEVEYTDAIQCSICEKDAQAISRLIAQSPLLNVPPGPLVEELTGNSAKAKAEATDLSDLNIVALRVFYEKLGAARALWGGAMCEPLAEEHRSPRGFVTRTAFGKQAEFEDSRAGYLMDWIVNEATRRPTKTADERDCRLSLLIQHEIACEGRIQATDLLGEVAQAWGRA